MNVQWIQTALNELAAAWVGADSGTRARITVAAETLERRLRRDAVGESESRTGKTRILVELPLSVIFQIEDDNNTVSILHVRLIRRRPT